jgi:hypothetical protein
MVVSIFCVWQAYMDIRINNQAAKAQYQYKYVLVYSICTCIHKERSRQDGG